ncbi:hypothetical protein [Rahnella bonaserana]
MARKIAQYEVKEAGRDKGKIFILTEMSASQAERWALRALLAVGRSGIDIPEGIEKAGFSAIASFGLNLVMKLPMEDAEILLDEMFTCIKVLPDPKKPDLTRSLIEDDIEEVKTRVQLRKAIFDLHVDFLKAVVQ